jgi:hypothetical protein
VTASVRTLLTGLVDYAGLFPPASLGMGDAVANYAAYRHGPHAWMLGRFIVPTRRLDEFARTFAAMHRNGETPWPIAALAGSDVAADAVAIAAFNADHDRSAHHDRTAGYDGVARIDTVEIKLEPGVDPADVAARLPSGLTLWFEITPGPSLGADLARIAESGHGAKLRTGGVTPELIPSTSTVAHVVLGCARAGVRLKATAGLHHPVRASHRLTYADDSPTAVMHGFLNVFVAAALARDLVLHGYPDPEAQATIVALLDETDPRAFTWRDDGVSWRGQRVEVETLSDVRERGARSFGSCSFDEPVGDLRQLGLL